MKDLVPFMEYGLLSHTEAAVVAIIDFVTRGEAWEYLWASV